MPNFQQLFAAVREWQTKQFGNPGPLAKIKHLAREVSELERDPQSAEEYADCLMLLIGAWAESGRSCEDFIRATEAKLAVNKTRKWGVPDEDGVAEHVETKSIHLIEGPDLFVVLEALADTYQHHSDKPITALWVLESFGLTEGKNVRFDILEESRDRCLGVDDA